MKACVKATGEIVEVEFTERKTHTDEVVYITQEGCLIEESRLDFNVETIDYWTKLEHQYAGMAMQGMVKTYEQMMRADIECRMDCCEHVDAEVANGVLRSHADACAEFCIEFAHTLVEKMKEKK